MKHSDWSVSHCRFTMWRVVARPAAAALAARRVVAVDARWHSTTGRPRASAAALQKGPSLADFIRKESGGGDLGAAPGIAVPYLDPCTILPLTSAIVLLRLLSCSLYLNYYVLVCLHVACCTALWTLKDRRVFFETYGCQMNTSDAEVVWSIMKDAGCTRTDSPETADVVFILTCAVRENAESKVWNRLHYFASLRVRHGGCGYCHVGVVVT